MNMLFHISIYFVVISCVNASWTYDTNTLRATANGDDRRKLQGTGVGEVLHFRLINATVGNKGERLIDPITNGTVIRLENYPSNQLFSVEAVVSNVSGPVGSVRFAYAGKTNFRVETTSPYSLCGDKTGKYTSCPLLVAGTHTIGATPFSLVAPQGTMGKRYSVSFTIVNTAPLPAPVPVPVPVPTRVPTRSPTTSPSESPSSDLPAGWIEVNSNATIDARHEACFVMVGRKAYLLAGRNIKPVNIYDPVSRTWTNGQAPPIQLHHTQCIVVDDSIWLVSPWTSGYPMEKNVENIHIYNTITNTWSTRPGLPPGRQRGGAAVVLVGRKIYISHGNIGGHETANYSISLNWLDSYDIDQNIWTTHADAPHIRDHTGGAYVNGRICVAGGRDGGQISFFSKVVLPTDCYDPVTNTWSIEANIPQGRAGSSYGRTCDGKLMVAGGEGPSSAYSNVDVFDGTTWTSVDSLNIPRHGSGLAVDCICNQIHIASGARTRGGRYEIKSVETYFPNGVDVPCLA